MLHTRLIRWNVQNSLKVIKLSIDYVVGKYYTATDVKEMLLVHFYSCKSVWTDGMDKYIFKHVPMRKLKLRFQLEHIIYQQLDINDCCGPARLGL